MMCHTHYWYAIGLKVPNLFSRSANMLVQHDCISYAALSNHPMYISSAPPQTFACWMWDTEAIQVFMQCFTGIQLRWPSYGSNVWVELYFTVIAIPVKCWFVRSERKYYHATKEGSFLNKMNKFLGLYDVSHTQQASMKLRLSKYALKSPKQ